MKKMISVIALLTPLSLAGCGDDDEKTVVIQPPPAQSGAVVVPQRSEPNTVVVPRSESGVKVCPEGTTTC